ncbi:unnamed protein product [Prorocentrum cordatum]|uniref:Uncharacterized protein n=1 Tax=Prorocentrum cordatum TaxID=2364126 RepID=A0ABN9X4J5_9DINO|nr:unnamed protein product [Polarella glacialis]
MTTTLEEFEQHLLVRRVRPRVSLLATAPATRNEPEASGLPRSEPPAKIAGDVMCRGNDRSRWRGVGWRADSIVIISIDAISVQRAGSSAHKVHCLPPLRPVPWGGSPGLAVLAEHFSRREMQEIADTWKFECQMEWNEAHSLLAPGDRPAEAPPKE